MRIVIECIVLVGVCAIAILHMDGEKLLSDIFAQDESVEERFEQLFTDYDYSTKSSFHEKDIRKKKRMKTMY